MIHWQQTMILLFCLVQFDLALPFPLSYQEDSNTSTSTSLSSTSPVQTAGPAAPSTNLFSNHPFATTKPLATNHTIQSQPTFPTPGQPQWSPGDISTVVFGCIASILGFLTLYLMLWLGWRGPGISARYEDGNGSSIGPAPDDRDLPLGYLTRDTDIEVAPTERH